jgi:hypothetical protein
MHSFTRIFKLFLKRIGLRKGKWKNSLRTPDHLFEPTVEGMRYLIKNNGLSMLKIYSYSRSNMIADGVFASLFHRVFKLGSNLRLYAKRVDNSNCQDTSTNPLQSVSSEYCEMST